MHCTEYISATDEDSTLNYHQCDGLKHAYLSKLGHPKKAERASLSHSVHNVASAETQKLLYSKWQ